MIKLLLMLVAAIPFLLIGWLGERINLQRVYRSRQFLLPVVALVFCVTCFFSMERIQQGMLHAITQLPVRIATIAPDLAASVDALIQEVNWDCWLGFLINPLLLLGYFLIKAVLLPLMSRIFSGNSPLHRDLAGLFYQYEPDKNFWAVKNRYGQLKRYFSDFYHAALILSTLLFLASVYWIEQGRLTAPYYPFFGVLLLGELYAFLDGLTRTEYFQEILGEEEDPRKIVNYSLMRKFLRTVFARHLTAENTITHYASGETASAGTILEGLLVSDDPVTVSCAKYYQALHSAGVSLEANYLYSSLDLLHGRSVLFNNPFYWDLIPYLFYPMNRTLLRHKKVLILLGRHSVEQDVQEWLRSGVSSITNIPSLWHIGMLEADAEADPDIGILSRSSVHDCMLHAKKQAFFAQVEFVVILEPSKLVSTAQIGLNSIIRYCKGLQKDVTFCACDKNCDGLVDALSHLLMTDISVVSATNQNHGTTSYMCWDYDAAFWQHSLLPNISRYLGIGTELSVAALKNQVQQVYWYGGETYPVRDQLWIDRQYYFDMLQYAGLPTKQEELQERFQFVPDLWSAKIQKNGYITVEDESNNMFEMIRAFSTRVSDQGFINVISADYLLKDYMADNASIFLADPKAIPYIVADYARTSRNVIIRLLLMFSSGPIAEEDLLKELSLVGIPARSVREAVWQMILDAYSTLDAESADDLLKQELVLLDYRLGERFVFDASIIESYKHFSMEKNRYEILYAITDAQFLQLTTAQLKSAAYLAEDEQGDTHYLGTELYGHIFQKHLPGQMFTFDGKYYEMCSVSADLHVLVRRASDHITGRRSYRQLRQYTIERIQPITDLGAERNVSGILVSRQLADLHVATPAYLSFENHSDFFRAKRIEINQIPVRSYRRKQILRIQFAGMDPGVRYTLTFLLNELFATLFGDHQAYLSAITETPDFMDNTDPDVPYNRPLCYTLEDQSTFADQGNIYLVEDSQVDLGLMIAFERNLIRIMEMITDYLQWHTEKILMSAEESAFETIASAPATNPVQPRNGSTLQMLWKKFRQALQEFIYGTEDDAEAPASKAAAPRSTVPEETVLLERLKARVPYDRKNFLLLGSLREAPVLKTEETLGYLKRLGFGNSSLRQAREGKNGTKLLEGFYHPQQHHAQFCQFCGVELVGTEFETLPDGRKRCMNCGHMTIRSAAEASAIFRDVLRNLESFFGIQIHCGIRLELVSAQKIQRARRDAAVPTQGLDVRTVGAVVSSAGGFRLLLEQNAPRTAAILSIVHALTEIWQQLYWDKPDLIHRYGKTGYQEVCEGMAVWAEVQYAMLINETMVAKRLEITSRKRTDACGKGFRRYLTKYPFSEGCYLSMPTPFQHRNHPL